MVQAHLLGVARYGVRVICIELTSSAKQGSVSKFVSTPSHLAWKIWGCSYDHAGLVMADRGWLMHLSVKCNAKWRWSASHAIGQDD